eukprot:m.230753 g.230753  ORF g.230753 m.230753 type:complete len:283 (+) comp18138_c0_seq1:66-914(+)
MMIDSGRVVCMLGFLSLAMAFSTTSIGDRLVYSYNIYSSLPTTTAEATKAGWIVNSSCHPVYGHSASKTAGGASQETPITLFFNGAGQISGIGMHYYGKVSNLLVERGFLKTVESNVHSISVLFRAATPSICGSSSSSFPLGDRLTVHPDTINYSLPVIETEAGAARWTNGSCFASMGYHHFFDLTTAPQMSWVADNMLPISLMYNEGVINAMFFAASTVQQAQIFRNHMWDRVPLPDVLMCKNWCDKDCKWHDTDFWSTAHIFFRDHTKVTCPGGCTLGCC